MRRLPIYLLVLASLALFFSASAGANEAPAPNAPFKPDVGTDEGVAIFAGGCFWCVEEAFDQVEGVVSTTSGYTGGHLPDPSYRDVTAETSGHAEAVKVVYKTDQVDYEHLLDTFWHNIDPTDDGGQFCDRGDSYRSEIFYVNDAQKKTAEQSKQALQDDPDAPSPIVTEIVAATTFYPAEEYHQNYYQKNSLRYKFYKNSCRRTATLEKRWGDKAGGPDS
ncbi:peptide-methionine (S)-S-oxide reductase MsrA [Salinisphaera sp.]|uniref:peptide-methionine (S)-S-oxide reductase MsrA n=1 Tax=Salinisphaera sp. TaxID=1914330 RepID=UPI000C54F26D|nr:peptide-methionine (S)-S-oxide reductase MsrA [Salinisphaera sp.]MBS63758.1 peptide-methionine (S)-S-oxide reductase [Salinisphaera sp.]